MADNYLERRMEALQQGVHSSVGKGINLECLMERVRKTSTAEADPAYVIHPMQMSSIAAIAKRLDFCDEFDLDINGPQIHLTAKCHEKSLHLGMLVETLILKAAEMNLCAAVESGNLDESIIDTACRHSLNA